MSLQFTSALIAQLRRNGEIMKRRSYHKRTRERSDELRLEYRFDYRKAKLNRFAKRMSVEAIAVVLDHGIQRIRQNRG